MKDERELLEMAAKAAGIKIVDCGCRYQEWPFKYAEGQDRRGHWNPLTDDGDALRLAVKLSIRIYPPEPHLNCHKASSNVIGQGWYGGPSDGDPYAATRRAIVRAAAAIGEAMP